jgi:hypothetical protein
MEVEEMVKLLIQQLQDMISMEDGALQQMHLLIQELEVEKMEVLE